MTSVTLNSLNDVLAYIQNDPPPSQLAQNLRAFVKRDVGETILASVNSEGHDPLNLLHPQTHSLGLLFILSARLAGAEPNVSFEYIATFCSTFAPFPTRYAPERVSLLARAIAYVAETHQNHSLAIGPLKTLLARYPPSAAYLTTIHCTFLRTCLKAECWSHALPVLSVPLTEVDRNLSDVTYLDNLTYQYLGGVILTVLKRYEEAEEFFENAASVPGIAVSAVQLEALKKLSLVQLILYGKTKSLPKYASSALPRLFKQTPYQLLVKNFPGSIVGLSVILEKEAAIFIADGNVGLIKQVIHHAPRWIVRKLTDTYTTLSLEEISKAIGTDVKKSKTAPAIEEATLLILGMIERDEIHATISPSTSGNPAAATVTFRDPPPPKHFDPVVLERILADAQMQSAQLGMDDRMLGKSKAYIFKAVKDREYGSGMQYDELEGGMGEVGVYGEWDP
ncbi:hypothetical protein FRB95_003150 [Tulasnella sp. JGI-2019a]|nr:hypothetical protein FRB93_003625 [Tulasnella sp. JGI-2019a]KAG9031104.1 hypothetical protein FRB95_003150 [Tulasnella sp. JGI-2019a]